MHLAVLCGTATRRFAALHYRREAICRHMTEDDTRALLRDWNGDGLERWIADQPWRPTPHGWEVEVDLEGWNSPSSRRLPGCD
jgi:hypothetical protein